MSTPHTITIFLPSSKIKYYAYGELGNCPGLNVRVNRSVDTVRENDIIDNETELTPIAGKDEDDKAHVVKTDSNGRLDTTSEEVRDIEGLQQLIIHELQKINLHLQSMTDERILPNDVGDNL